MEPFAENRKARHAYETLETFEAGLMLSGQEVKSVRDGGANLTGSYLSFRGGELYLMSTHIAPYRKAGPLIGYHPDRPRKALLRKKELRSLLGKIEQKGLTLVPFSLYARGRHIKLRFGLCRGKKTHEKKEALKQRDIDRDVRRHLEEE